MAGMDMRTRRGLATLRQIHGRAGIEVLDTLARTAPELSRFVIAFAFGDIYARPQLSLRDRQLATVASVATLGHALPQLKSHINGALNLGITKTEIIELLMQMAVYAGFPAAINAIGVAADVFAERHAAKEPKRAARSPQQTTGRRRPRAQKHSALRGRGKSP